MNTNAKNFNEMYKYRHETYPYIIELVKYRIVSYEYLINKIKEEDYLYHQLLVLVSLLTHMIGLGNIYRKFLKKVATDGLHWTFSPVLCLGRDTRWGRINETFGEDSYLTGELGAAIIRGYQGEDLSDGEHILACAKHYLGYGEAVGARDACDSEVTERKVREVFLPPFKKAVEAGWDIIDTAMSPFSMGTSQPATEVMVETFKGTEYDTGLDQNLLAEIADYFRPMQEEALKSGLLNPKVMGVDIKTLLYQVPGGMLSNLVSQLKEAKAEDKYYDVLREIPEVRKDFGEPPLVTPSSQIVGTQAVLNVLQGERYKMVTKESKKVLGGEFGETVKPFNKDVQKKAIGDVEPITCRPADLIPPQLDKFREECKEWMQQEEDVLSYALFPQVAMDFFKHRQAQQTAVDVTAANTENKAYPV